MCHALLRRPQGCRARVLASIRCAMPGVDTGARRGAEPPDRPWSQGVNATPANSSHRRTAVSDFVDRSRVQRIESQTKLWIGVLLWVAQAGAAVARLKALA